MLPYNDSFSPVEKLIGFVVFPRASLKRSTRTRTRKNSISVVTDIVCTYRSSGLVRRKTRPPPLQIIPEVPENDDVIDISPAHSPTTARPTQFPSQQLQLEPSRITLSAYTFSIDDALLMFGDDAPRSPALSASSSTDGASSEGAPTTPGTSDDEEGCDFIPPIPRSRPQRIFIHPLRITKTRSLICQEDEDVHGCFEREQEKVATLPLAEAQPEVEAAAVVIEESGQDFYTREFEDFVSLSPVVAFHSSPARRDSLILAAEAVFTLVEVPEPKSQGRSRHSKPLPLLPPATPPAFTLPSILPLVQTTAHTSVIRRKRHISPIPDYPSPSPLVEPRPFPREAVPQDIEDCMFPEEDFNIPSRESILSEQGHDPEESASIYSQPSLVYTPSTGSCPLPPAIPEIPLTGMYGEVTLPRSSTDSDAPRSSVDSTLTSISSTSSNTPISPPSFPNSPSFEDQEFEATERLRSRWSSSTLGSQVVEPPRSTLLSPLRNVFGSRVRRVPLQKIPPRTPPQPTPSKFSMNKRDHSTRPSQTSTPSKDVRLHESRSSTSSAGDTSESESHDGSPGGGPQRKPIPILMFLRATSLPGMN